MGIEPLSTILTWVIGICAIIFVPTALIFFIILIYQLIKD